MFVDGIFSLLASAFYLTSYIEDKNCFPLPLSHEEEVEAFRLMKEGDEAAKNKLVNHNMRLVVHIAKKYVGSFDSDDLISIGSIGLLKAINTFRYDKGTHFATYASKCIDNEILMCLRSNKKNGCLVSLSQPVGSDKEGNEITVMDLLSSDIDVAKQVERDQISKLVMSVARKSLSEREFAIICMRFGLNGEEVLPQRRIAEKFGISRSYISRLEKKALEKIRQYLEDNKIDLT